MTLTRVLSQDETKICEVWMRGIHQDVGQTVLRMVSLKYIFLDYGKYS